MSRGVVACIAAILSIGGSGVIAQTTLLRELLFQFAGSELYLGLIIGNWIAAEALGAFAAGRFMPAPTRTLSAYLRLTILFSLLFPLMLFLARAWRYLLNEPIHETVSLWQTLAVSIIVIFPLALIHGAQFVLATSLHAELTDSAGDSPGKVYGLETVGTVVGGAAASFLLIPLVPPFQITVMLLLLNGVICAGLQKTLQQRFVLAEWAVLLLPLFASAALAFGGAAALEKSSLRLQWHGDSLVTSRNSPYQNIAVIRSGEQQTFYLDGVPLVALPDHDIARNEESAHLPLLAHPLPRRVLLLGGGVSGIIGEILKHPSVERLDYLELDPAVVQTVEKYAPETIRKELHDPRVKLLSMDGRAFLRGTGQSYDVILLGMTLPQSLRGNRFFTAEFIAALQRVLEPDGVISYTATGSLNYYGDDLKEVTRSLMATIRTGFPHLLIVPGDRNLFVASPDLPLETLTAEELFSRFEARGLQAGLISGPHLQWLLHSTPLQWFRQTVGEGGTVNSDFSPYLLTRYLAYVTTQFNPEMKPLLELFARISGVHIAAVFLALTMAILLLAKQRGRVAVLWTMTTSGFAAMLLELAFFFIFQLFQGVMLQTIGLLIALFMAGLWGGSRVTAQPTVLPRGDRRRLFAGDVILLLLAGAVWLISTGKILSTASSTALICLIILPLIFFTGFAAGMQFPSATRLTADRSGPGTSLVYGCDLLGGWLGGLLGGALLLPLLGFAQVALLLLLLKGGSILCLYLQGE